MSDIFGIENYNVIEDEENYYFFRSLEPGDIEDLDAETIQDDEGKYIRLRTDRERWEETNKGKNPRWTEKDEISLEQLYHHIKYNYSLQTNCISLTGQCDGAGEVLSETIKGHNKDEVILNNGDEQL